jgi:GTP-binding protein
MKFVDEAIITVQAGKGGDGGLSFRREKFIPFGGPDGGDGGDGGSIYLLANPDLNTLVDFRVKRQFKGGTGQTGMGSQCTGKSGADCIVEVPVGTLVYDNETKELIGDLTKPSEKLLVAQGGFHGLGNLRFKSSTNQAPRKISKGKLGECRVLHLELKVLADVGLMGLPNAGKSSLIRAVSAATPKVADYPFTTLHPNLGVVRIAAGTSFVMADIPGIVEGAAEGVGLGVKFLKHLSRTKLLLHVVDLMPVDLSSPLDAIHDMLSELKKFSTDLYAKPRWLVFNKIDLYTTETANEICAAIVKELNWQGQVFKISAMTTQGTQGLCYAIAKYLAEMNVELQNGSR